MKKVKKNRTGVSTTTPPPPPPPLSGNVWKKTSFLTGDVPLLAAFWENASKDAEIDGQENGENEHNNGDNADDYDFHGRQKSPENLRILIFLFYLQLSIAYEKSWLK